MFTSTAPEAAPLDAPIYAPPALLPPIVQPQPAAALVPVAAPSRAPRNEAALAEVLRHPGVWRRSAPMAPSGDVLPTGNAELDAQLPGGGWPRGALTEIL